MRGRARVVGDVGPNAPEHWEGGLGGPDIHAMGWIRTDSEQGREKATRIIRDEMEATGGVEIRFVQDTMALAHENGIGSEGEHFGFADPISQPPIEGADAPSYPGDGEQEPDGTWRALKPGEFLLGYEDEAGPAGCPGARAVRTAAERYVRRLPQALSGRRRVSPLPGERPRSRSTVRTTLHHQELVAAKMMGRWRERLPGRPVARQGRSRDRGGPPARATTSRTQATTRACAVRSARTCVGAIRGRRRLKRATAVRRHRLIRRGVEYGPHLAAGALEDDGVDRGLVNLFIQADIERQFEFVQKEWMKGGEFIGLDPNEQDPINGVGGEGSQMSVPGAKRPFLFDLPTFVIVKGGEYLFVPGLKALEGLIEQKF